VSVGRNTKEEERERRGSPSPATSSSSGDGGNRAVALGLNGALAQERGVWKQKEEEREVSELYMDREREKGEAKGANGRGLP
jgi:hypothetical protein